MDSIPRMQSLGDTSPAPSEVRGEGSTHAGVRPASNRSRRYVLISPCRDESQYAQRTLDSVDAQTVKPTLWVIVDDGSTDATPQMLADFAKSRPWVRVIKRTNRGDRVLGAGVVQAFNDGLATVDLDQFDYLCKLDLDLDLPANYFQGLIEKMEADERYGAVSGKPFFERGGQLHPERCGDEHAVGMTKFYRVECFRAMGGFVPALMWDGIDTHRIRRLGWKAASFNDPALRFTHLRPMGTSHKSWWTGRVRHGTGQHFMGTHPLYLLASATLRLFHPPVLLGSMAILYGYLRGFIKGSSRFDEPGFGAFVRRYQLLCLAKGKRAATAQVEREYADRFKSDAHA